MPNKSKNFHLPVKVHLIALAIAIILVLASLFIPITVNSKEDLNGVRLGLPLRFVIQNQTAYDPPFPSQTRFYSFWENPTQINFPYFFINVLLVFFIINGGLNILLKTRWKKIVRNNKAR